MTYLGAAPTTTASRKSQTTYRYLCTAGLTVISGADLNNNTLSCDPLDTEVFMNGLKLDSTDTTITATQVSLVSPAAAGDEIEVVAYRTFESADHYNKSTADTRYVNTTGDTMTGNLGISGTSVASASLTTDTYTSGTELKIQGDGAAYLYNKENQMLRFGTNNLERLRIENAGDVVVGSTSSFGTSGITLGANNVLYSAAASQNVANFQRYTSDGEIVRCGKGGTTVGSIGVVGSNKLYVHGDSIGLGIGDDNLYPTNSSGASNDNAVDVGDSSVRFDDVYATNGTIQTSDENEKQNIASLTSAEITAATAISKLFKTFKWKDKVAAKGDNARTHTGVIAQQVETAMSDAGLDAGNYAFFISTTWWEADETYTDDEGAEQTRTNTYDTQEEAPEGATERNRKGIRYPELLAFIGAATEQRLTSIESRLTALEGG